ncbi:hypothetical protein ACTHGU_04735 [Chitinophagaceae bacterium MMS25-I14]
MEVVSSNKTQVSGRSARYSVAPLRRREPFLLFILLFLCSIKTQVSRRSARYSVAPPRRREPFLLFILLFLCSIKTQVSRRSAEHSVASLRRRERLLLLMLLLICKIAQAQPQTYNHIQYHSYQWRAFHTSAFHIYFPQGSDSLCKYVAKEYPEAVKRIKQRMGTSLAEVPAIIIYPSVDQQYETNIGSDIAATGTPEGAVTLPTFILKGNRMVLHFNGSYDALKTQLYEAIARSIWEQQNQNNLAGQATGVPPKELIPYWFKEGAIRYFARQWPVTAEDELRRSFGANHYQNWEEITGRQPALAGQAFCYFLSEKFYPTAVMQTYFQVRKRKAIPAALRLVTKTRIDSLYAQCFHFYQNRFATTANDTPVNKTSSLTETNVIPHRPGAIRQVLQSPDGRAIAYIVSTPHKRTVYTYQPVNKSTYQLIAYTMPPWLADHSADNYPLISWADNGKDLLVALPEKGKIIVRRFSITGTFEDKYTLPTADGIQSLQQTDDHTFLLSAWKQGELDVIEYNAKKNKYQFIGKYDYDQFRLVKTTGNSDPLRFIRTYRQKHTDSGWINDTQSHIRYDKPILKDDNEMLFTGTITGEERWYEGTNADTFIAAGELIRYRPLQYNNQTGQIVTWDASKDSLYVHSQDVENWIRSSLRIDTVPTAWLTDLHKRAAAQAKEDSIIKASKDDTPGFLDGVLNGKNNNELAEKRQDSIKKSLDYDPKKVQFYVLQLYSAYFSAQVNNDYYMNRYQPYLNYQGQFKFPEVGGMAQGGFSDLLENHHFNIGYRLPAGTEGSMFFFKYRNTAKKLDWGLSYYRNVETLKPDPGRLWVNEEGLPYPNAAKVKTNYEEISLHYPLSYYSSLDFTTAARYDRTIFLATESYSLKFDPIQSWWSISSLSYSISKLQPTVPLLYKGFTAKATVDLFKGFTQKESALTGNTIQLAYHQPLYKYITLVTKLQAGYSGGDSRVLYNLGGVDNAVNPRVDSTKHFAQDAPYAFTTLITPFRGYYQNTLYGNEYALLNMDVYFPLFQTLIPIETPLSSINNLQLGIFTDIATAKETWQQPQVNNGIKSAYGLSARTTLAGYPLRFDIAWPNDGSRPVWYLSLNVK